jgi:hypothetical protein
VGCEIPGHCSESPHRLRWGLKAEEFLSDGLCSLDPRRFQGKSQQAHNSNANLVRVQALLARHSSPLQAAAPTCWGLNCVEAFPGFFP